MSPIRRTCPHIPTTRTCPQGHVLVFPLPLSHFEHQKVPMWALSGAHTPPLSLSLVSNTRTSPCVARSGARAPPLSLSLVSNLPSPSPSSIYLFSLFLY